MTWLSITYLKKLDYHPWAKGLIIKTNSESLNIPVWLSKGLIIKPKSPIINQYPPKGLIGTLRENRQCDVCWIWPKSWSGRVSSDLCHPHAILSALQRSHLSDCLPRWDPVSPWIGRETVCDDLKHSLVRRGYCCRLKKFSELIPTLSFSQAPVGCESWCNWPLVV